MNKYLAIFLMNLPGVGRKKLHLIEEKILRKNLNIDNETAVSINCVSELLQAIDISLMFQKNEIKKAYESLQHILEDSYKLNISIIGHDEDGFPINLKNIPDAPLYLFYKGDIRITNADTNIAVIGTRNPTPHGESIGVRFGEVLAENNVTVISGLALGCDTCGHLGCLKKDGKTVAVMAEGLHKIYPAKNKILAQEILDKGGCLISEYAPGQRAFKNNFVERDRLQSGLSAGIIVVETDVSGGTMHTVNYAIEQNRYVAAYKHSDKYSSVKQVQGNIELIKSQKAISLRNSDDVENYIHLCKKSILIPRENKIVVYEQNLFE